MSKAWKPKKKTVEIAAPARPSRIRRDPVRAAEAEGAAKDGWWRPDEWEIPLAILGIIVFALAINVITFAISEFTN